MGTWKNTLLKLSKEWELEKRDKSKCRSFINKKFKNHFIFFYLHFTLLCGPWLITEILKKKSILKIYQLVFFWGSLGTMTYKKDNFCFHESIFHRQIKLISYRSEFWQLRRKPALLFSKWLFVKNFFDESWVI